MQIIDTHVHFWDLSNKINSWVIKSNNSKLIRNFSIADYLAYNPQPVGILTIEAADGVYSLDEVIWIQKFLNNNNKIDVKHIAYIDMTQNPEKFELQLLKYKKFNFVAGFRDIMSFSEYSKYSPCNLDITLHKYKLDNLFVNLCWLARNNYIFNCQMYPIQLLRIADLIVNSKVTCIIDHCGMPLLDSMKEKLIWQEMLKMYSKLNVYFKISGFNMNNANQFATDILLNIFNKISFDNLTFGSNYPLVNVIDIINVIKKTLKENNLSQHQDKIFYLNAKRIIFS